MLKPIYASYGSLDSVGLFEQVADGDETLTRVVEGGYLGLIVPTAGSNIPRVDVATSAQCASGNYPLLGLLDDSTTGSGYGTLFGSTAPGIAGGGWDPLGVGTHVASNRLGIWTEPGIFLTDIFDPNMIDQYGEESGVTCGDPLYWDTSGSPAHMYWTNAAVSGNIALATFIAFIDDVTDPLMSRVQPVPSSGAGTPGFTGPFMLFKFKGFVAPV